MTILLELSDVSMHFPVKPTFWGSQTGVVKAVDGVSLYLKKGETLALVGESGCGKSTLARLILRLSDAKTGQIFFDGQNISTMSRAKFRPLRRRMQIVFQDPFASLTPHMTVRQIIEEPLLVHGVGNKASRFARCSELLKLVGLDQDVGGRYPHEFSGGQRQRIGIARALALEPELIVCDEPVSALDVSIQAQVINLLNDLKRRLGLSYLFISHDIAVVKHMADRMAVMYLGRVVETGSCEAVFARPRHPYTHSLLSAVPQPNPARERKAAITCGDLPSPLAVPAGCRFHPRCPFAIEKCKTVDPPLRKVDDAQSVSCHRWEELPNFAQDIQPRKKTPSEMRLELFARVRERVSNATEKVV
jgi:oligopeptide transport system ATP-binding protein